MMKYNNPIISGFHPDPSICRAGEDYYLVTSSFEYFPGVPIFHSRDLVNWRQIGHCLTRRSQLELDRDPSSNGIYAPTIRYHEGRFYMVTTNILHGGNFFVWTDDPSGEWSEPIWVDQPGIDPSLFFDADGKVYFTSSYEGILQSEIDIETGHLLREPSLIWGGTGGAYPEGPHLYKVDGVYYLLISEGGTELGHMITIARSNSPYGPFESCNRNPILTHRSLNTSIKSVGHADMIQAHNGSWWTVCLGTRPIGYPYKHHLGRETFLAPVIWAKDGWPVIGNQGTVDYEMEAELLPLVPWEVKAKRDDFNDTKLDCCWNFLRNPKEEDWSLGARQGSITLNGSEITLNDSASPAFIGRRQEHFSCRVLTLLDFEPSADGEEAGLTVLMNERFHYEIAVTKLESKKCIIFRRRIGSLWKVEYCQEYAPGQVTLEIRANDDTYNFYYAEPGKESVKVGEGECSLLSTEVSGGFTGVFFGLYATGNGRKSGAPAYFDWFDYASFKSLSVNSKIDDFLKNPVAKEVLDRYLPGFTANQNIEMLKSLTLKMIASFPHSGISEEVLKAIVEELTSI